MNAAKIIKRRAQEERLDIVVFQDDVSFKQMIVKCGPGAGDVWDWAGLSASSHFISTESKRGIFIALPFTAFLLTAWRFSWALFLDLVRKNNFN